MTFLFILSQEFSEWKILKCIKEIGVLRDTARAPQSPTNKPTVHQMNRQCLYVPMKAYFRENLALSGPKILIFTGGSKSFRTHISHVRLVFWSGMGSNWQNMPIFGPKIHFFMGRSKSYGTHVREKPPRHLVCIVFWSGMGSNGPKMSALG